jgi:hypothetical protein
MQNDISGIVELLRQINNRTSYSPYNDGFIDGIHRNFPDLLYNNGRFTSVQSLMEYINHQMQNNYNTYNRNFNEYWASRPIEAAPAPGPAPAASASQSTGINDIFAQLHNDVLEGARILGSLSNATTRTATPVDFPARSYMDDEALLNGIPLTPPRPPIILGNPPPVRRRGMGARELFRNLIPDFMNFPEPTLFMASARTFRLHPLNELNEQHGPIGLTEDQINSLTHTEERAEGQCPICYDGYSGNDLRVINVCNHAFHAECIEPWLRGNGTCPMCRANLLGIPPPPPPPPAAPAPQL